jgi:5-methylcytosine-specific restriction endonuclease McrA
MSDILNQHIVLVINRNFQILGITTPKQALISMCSSSDGENLASKSIIIDYEKDGEGEYSFDKPINMKPVFWDEWLEQEIRPFDNFVVTPKRKIRIPTVLQAHNCTKIGFKELKPTNRNLLSRYGNRCAYTNKLLTIKSMTKDHIIPKSRWKELGKSGSPDGWDNLVPCDKELNHKKGNSLNEEIGLKLLVKVSAPRPIPISELIKEVRSRDWELFMHK